MSLRQAIVIAAGFVWLDYFKPHGPVGSKMSRWLEERLGWKPLFVAATVIYFSVWLGGGCALITDFGRFPPNGWKDTENRWWEP